MICNFSQNYTHQAWNEPIRNKFTQDGASYSLRGCAPFDADVDVVLASTAAVWCGRRDVLDKNLFFGENLECQIFICSILRTGITYHEILIRLDISYGSFQQNMELVLLMDFCIHEKNILRQSLRLISVQNMNIYIKKFLLFSDP